MLTPRIKEKFRIKVAMAIFCFIAFVFNINNDLYSQPIISIKNGATFFVSQNATVQVNGSLNVNSGATLQQANSGLSTVNVSADLQIDGTLTGGQGKVSLNGNTNSQISGSGTINFNALEINKSSASDDVTLAANINIATDLNILDGDLSLDNTANRTIDVNNSVSISNGASFTVPASATSIHTLNIANDLTVNGTLDFYNTSNSVMNVVFDANAQSILSGSGSIEFAEVTINKDNNSDLVDFSVAFTAQESFLTLTRGVYKLSGTYTYNNTFFKAIANNISIPNTTEFWWDNPNVSIDGQNADITLAGTLRFTQDNSNVRFTVGTLANPRSLFYTDGAIYINDATVGNGGCWIRIYGALARATGAGNDNATINFTQASNQPIEVGYASTGISNRGMFDIGAANSTISWSEGELRIKYNNSSFSGGDIYLNANNGTITGGGVLVISDDANNTLTDIRIYSPKKAIGYLTMAPTGAGNPRLNLVDSLSILGDLTLTNRALITNNHSLYIGDDFVNNSATQFSFDAGTGIVHFNGAANETQDIAGTQTTRFNTIVINRTGAASSYNNLRKIVHKQSPIYVASYLRFISNHYFEITDQNVTFGPNARVYTDWGDQESFSAIKCMTHHKDSSRTAIGTVRREIAQAQSLPFTFKFPFGTYSNSEEVLSWATVTFITGGATFGANAYVESKAIASPHTQLEQNNISLNKYWYVNSNDITVLSNGANLEFNYDISEVLGSEPDYEVIMYTPAYPTDPITAYWRLNPGQICDVLWSSTRTFYCQQTNYLNGDWSAGEASSAIATYYSRQNGNYFSASTWSKIGFGGVISDKAPSKPSDIIRIQGHTVTVDNITQYASKYRIENGGVLKIEPNMYVYGDTLRVESNGTLEIQDVNGITQVTNSGNVRTSVRDYGASGIYKYSGSIAAQNTGDGVPNIVRSVMVEKPDGVILNLSKSLSINDSLVINSGTLDPGNFTINGFSSGKTFRMRGGELIVNNMFPTNYVAPTFTAGTIHFKDNAGPIIPSSGSSPGVAQYYNLKLAGNCSGFVTLQPSGQIRIKNDFDISTLNFTGGTTKRFYTLNSTVVFNGTTQNIPFRPNSPTDSSQIAFLYYDNLIIDSSGVKTLYCHLANTYNFIAKNLTIRNTATLKANVHNLEVQGTWTNTNAGSTFIPDNRTVIFRSPVLSYTNFVTSRDTTENPFDNVIIAGSGIVEPSGTFLVRGNLKIDSASNLKLNSNTMVLRGNWTNYKGTFNYGSTSKVIFNGTSTQTATKTTGNETFYQLDIINQGGVDFTGIGTTSDNGLIVQNTLNLPLGNLKIRGRNLTAYGTISRTGGTPGHIDGALRKTMDTNTTSKTYEVGYESNYTPVTIAFNGTGGTAGLVQVLSDTITAATSPISVGLLPASSGLVDNTNVRRQYTISIPSGSPFLIAPTTRNYNVTLGFNSAVTPSGDIRGGANALLFEARLWNGSAWKSPEVYINPRNGNRTTSTTRFDGLTEFGTLTIAEPNPYRFFSRQNGNWSDPNSWSTQIFGGEAAPIAPTSGSTIYIGDKDTITLNSDFTANGLVIVDSTGNLQLEDKIISGTGEFRMMTHSQIGIGTAAGITSSGASGNIQTTTRNYNYASHNRSRFEYTGALTQSTGNGLPSDIGLLKVNKSTNAVTLGSNINIHDSLHIATGTFTAGSDFSVKGNIRRQSGATFTASTFTVNINGTASQYIDDLATGELTFNNLLINKAVNTGTLYLRQDSPIRVNGTLTFETTNLAHINTKSYTGSYVYAAGSVTRTGSAKGHIYGDLRKVIGTGAVTVLYEVGDSVHYTPFTIAFAAGTGDASGIVSMENMQAKNHPEMVDAGVANPPVATARTLPRYWRLSLPSGSTFAKGTRTFSPRADYIMPNDIGEVDAEYCVDMCYIRKWTGGVDWQGMFPNGVGRNHDLSGTSSCADTRSTSMTETNPRFSYTGGYTSDGYYTQVLNVNTNFGSSEILSNGNTLLGDFVLGNQNSIVGYLNYYSIANGDWTNPSSWSTVSYSSTVNAGTYPRRQYDNVKIGNNKRIVLNQSIGHNTYSSVVYPLAGPVVTVEATGTLSFGTNILRGNAFTASPGATLEIGSETGINNTTTSSTDDGKGNILSVARTFSDSLNIVYTGEGKTVDNSSHSSFTYCRSVLSQSSSERRITRVYLYNGGGTVIDNSTNSSEDGYCFYYQIAGSILPNTTYTLQVERTAGSTESHYVDAYIDYDRDGNYRTTASEQIITSLAMTTASVSTTFTTPASLDAGYLPIRVRMLRNTSDYTSNGYATNPCVTSGSNRSGEQEDYSLKVVNASTNISQLTGNALPNNLRLLKTNMHRPTSTVTLSKNIRVIDSLHFKSGVFNTSTFNIDLEGNYVMDTLNGFTSNSQTISLVGKKNQYIRGTQTAKFNNLTINKDTLGVFIQQNTEIAGTLAMTSNTISELSDSKSLTFKSTASAITGTLSKSNMIKVSGDATNSGVVKKEFTNTAGAKSFLFPLGVDTLYNYANLSVTGTYASVPTISVQLKKGMHPDRLNDYILKKYWNVDLTNISAITANTISFGYNSQDTSGNSSVYIPGLFNTSNAWEINIGTTPIAYPSPISTSQSDEIEGDWTAGESSAFFPGRKFYSRATGIWNLASNWSNVSHSGPPSSYFPGQIFGKDTVYIDGHTIDFRDSTNISIDSLTIGGSFNGVSAGGRGILSMGITPLTKKLSLRFGMRLEADGLLQGTSPGSRRDTIELKTNLTNLADSVANSAGIFLKTDNSNWTTITFAGTGHSQITGTGSYGTMKDIIMNKTGGLSDTLYINSSSFATRSFNSYDYLFRPTSGVLKHYNNYPLLLAANSQDLNMGNNSGFYVTSNQLQTSGSLNSEVNTTIALNGGNFLVGDASDENFSYQTGTKMDITQGRFEVSGNFGRIADAEIDLYVRPQGEIKVLTVGNTDPAKVGFDISTPASAISMNGGRIIVCREIAGGVSNCRIDAENGTGITGGAIQLGDTTITPNGNAFKISGSTALWDLHCVGTTTTSLVEDITVQNDLTIDANSTMQLLGNTLSIEGDILNYGIFDGITSPLVTDARLLYFQGGNDQSIYNQNGNGLELYNLTLNKSAGKVTLAATGNSNLIVRNNFIFEDNNNAFIDASASNFGRYVESSPSGGSSPLLTRFGKGHVYGKLFRYIPTGPSISEFYVGSDSIDSYRPATLQISGTGGTAGMVRVLHYPWNHPRLDADSINLTKNVQRYWNIEPKNPDNSVVMALGVARSYNITLQYVNGSPGDLRGDYDKTLFDQFRWAPSCPDYPDTNLCPPITAYQWKRLESFPNDSSVKSYTNTTWGDYVISEPNGETFYSIADGNWDNVNTWSKVSYDDTNVADRIPDQNTDIVRIGNGKVVTVDAYPYKTVKFVVLEKYNNLPGKLRLIQPSLSHVKANSISIGDSCILETSNPNGVDNTGALQAYNRYLGVSNYIFSNNTDQTVGLSFPDSVASLTINNSGATLRKVYLSNFAGANTIKVRDSIRVQQGEFYMGGRNVTLYGNLSLYSGTVMTPTTNTFSFAGASPKLVLFDNTNGAKFNNLSLSGANVSLKLGSIGNADSSHIKISGILAFNDVTQIGDRTTNRKVILYNGASSTRLSANSGFVDGLLQRHFATATQNRNFDIGVNNIYTPADVYLTGAGGTAGFVSAIALAPVPSEPYSGNRLSSDKLDHYWRIVKADSVFALGTRTVNPILGFPTSELANFTTADAVLRRKSIPAETALWSERRGSDLTWNLATASVTIAGAANKFTGLGDFFVGEKQQRTFYSISTGNWEDNTTWAFDALGTIPAPAGVYPNNDWNETEETEICDIVVIDNAFNVTISAAAQLSSLQLTGGATLTMNQNALLSESEFCPGTLDLDDGKLNIKSPLGIDTDTTTSLLRFNTITFGPAMDYEFSGTVNQKFGTGFPDLIDNLIINNTGTAGNDLVGLPPGDLNITGDITVTDGDLRPSDATSHILLTGDLNASVPIDLTRDTNDVDVASRFCFDGPNSSNQIVSSTSDIRFYDVCMDRQGAGNGIVDLQLPIIVEHQIDMRELTNPNYQILAIGNNGAISIENTDDNAILDYTTTTAGPYRYIQTSLGGGLLNWEVTQNNNYIVPIGTFDGANHEIACITYISEGTGADGNIGFKTAYGSNTTLTDAHKEIQTTATNYLERFYTIDNVTTTIPGQFIFKYLDDDIAGDENQYTKVSKWTNPNETSPGSWALVDNGILTPLSNSFSTPTGYLASLFEGDYSIGDNNTFRRLFFSRQNGNWNNDQTWTASNTHTGAIFGVGIFPNSALDSVTIGGDDVVVLDQNRTIKGTAVGTSTANKGTLDLGVFVLDGEYFTLNDQSTLKIGHQLGISALPALTGAVQTTISRSFSDVGIVPSFEYNGTQGQITGSGLPSVVYNLTINNSGSASADSVKLSASVTINNNFNLTDGIFDLANFTSNSNGTGNATISSNGRLRIGANNTLLTSLNSFNSYTIDFDSWIDFYGGNQIISNVPLNLVGGLGNVYLLGNTSTKSVTAPLLVNGDLVNAQGVILQNNAGVNALSVYGNVFNDGQIENYGDIRIGN